MTMTAQAVVDGRSLTQEPRAAGAGYLVHDFDLLNVGDLDLLQQARAACATLVVGVLTDEAVHRHYGTSPVVPLAERMALVGRLRGVDDVVEHSSVPAGTAVVFRAATASPVVPDTAAITLSPSRQPQSPLLQAALRPLQKGEPDLSPKRVPCEPAERRGRVGYVPGAWDMFHVGHLNILLRAREQCDRLVVGVVTAEALAKAKGGLPIVSLTERLEVVRSMDMVDSVVVDRSSDKLDVWRQVSFHVLFKGDDWQGTPKGDKLERDMRAAGVEVRYFPYTAHTSSTMLRAVLRGR